MHQCVAGMVLRAISLYFVPSTIKYENVQSSPYHHSSQLGMAMGHRQVMTQDREDPWHASRHTEMRKTLTVFVQLCPNFRQTTVNYISQGFL